jgi:hypothetical protein
MGALLVTRKQLSKRAKEISDLRLKYYGDGDAIKKQYWALLEEAKLDPEKFSGYSRHDIFGIGDVELRKALIAKRIELHDHSVRECRNEVENHRIRLFQAHRLADNWSIGPALSAIAWCFGALLLERVGISPVVGAIAFGVAAILFGLNARDAALKGRDEAVKEAEHELEMSERDLKELEQREPFSVWERSTGSPDEPKQHLTG